jgi:streptogramin lyase
MSRLLPLLAVLLLAIGSAIPAAGSSGEARVAAKVKVGPGAGVPAVDRGAVWVPTTRDGSVVRVDTATKRVVRRIKLGTPPRFQGYLDSAVAAGGSIWVARDVGDEIVRIDPKTNRIAGRIKVEGRPGGLAVGGGYVWAFHFQTSTVTRVDSVTGAKKVFTVQGAFGTGIVYAAGAVWLLSEQPASVFELDPKTGATLAKIAVTPRTPPKHGIVDTWWVAAGGGSVWAVNANYDAVTRIDIATKKVVATVPVPVEIPFGIAVGKGAVWVAGAGKVVRIDPATNRVSGVVTLSKRSVPIFTQVALGPAGLWATDYEEGVLYRIASS